MNEKKLIEIASRIKNEHARANWLSFMRSVEAESEDIEDDLVEDISDGIAPVKVSELNGIEASRFSALQVSISNPFPQTQLIVESTGIDQRGRFGMTRLHRAVEDGDIELVRELLSAGADKTLQDTSGDTPLEIASQLGHLELIPLLK
jgi:ankyrin repeat protein